MTTCTLISHESASAVGIAVAAGEANARGPAPDREMAWSMRDGQGSPAPMTSSGKRAVPYWSSRPRAQRAAVIWGGGLRPVSVPVPAWRAIELPDLADEDLLVGINWTGSRLVGWDFTVAEVLNRLAHVLGEGPYAEEPARPPTTSGPATRA